MTLSMLSQYYDWQLIRELPLAELGGLLSYCKEKELQKIKLPIWFAQIAISKLTGEEPVTYEEMFNTVKKTQVKKKSGEDILAEFEGIIEEDMRKRGHQLC